jgi:hypothetical protein
MWKSKTLKIWRMFQNCYKIINFKSLLSHINGLQCTHDVLRKFIA